MSTVDEIKKKAMIEVATDPISLVPTLIGATVLAGMFAFKVFSFVYFGLAAGAVIWGVCSAWSRFFYSDAVRKKVSQAIEEAQTLKNKAEISDLRERLSKACSPLLDDILGLQHLIKSIPNGSSVSDELVVSAKALLDRSLLNLKQVPDLDELYNSIRSKATKDVIDAKRQKFIQETKENVEFIGKILVDSQNSSYSSSVQEEARQELLSRIECAISADQQMAEINLSLMSKRVPA